MLEGELSHVRVDDEAQDRFDSQQWRLHDVRGTAAVYRDGTGRFATRDGRRKAPVWWVPDSDGDQSVLALYLEQRFTLDERVPRHAISLYAVAYADEEGVGDAPS